MTNPNNAAAGQDEPPQSDEQLATTRAILAWEHEMLRRRSILKASLFELGASYFMAVIMIIPPLIDRPSSAGVDIFGNLLKSPVFLAAIGICFFQTLLILLAGRTFFVAASVFQYNAFVSLKALLTNVSLDKGQAHKATFSYGSESFSANPSVYYSAASGAGSLAKLSDYLARSTETERRARSRPNVLLFVGSAISFLGVLVFFATSPSGVPPEADRLTRLIDATPRIFLFLFIQVIAGFFLRQYRTGLEDYRFYEAVLRSRESQHISLLLRQEAGDSKAVAAIAEKMLENGDFMKLQKGETTFILETQKLEKNEVHSLADMILNVFNQSGEAKPATTERAKGKGKTGE